MNREQHFFGWNHEIIKGFIGFKFNIVFFESKWDLSNNMFEEKEKEGEGKERVQQEIS